MTDIPDDDDAEVLSLLAASGVDMTRPIAIDFFIDAKNEEQANAIAAACSAAGFTAEIDHDPGEPDEDGVIDEEDEEFGPSWTVYVETQTVPSHEEVTRIQRELSELAAPLGGIPDGWGVPIDESESEDVDTA